MNINDNIGECLGLAQRKGQAIGIELEYEGWNRTRPVMQYWSLGNDNSLRNNGVEYVSKVLDESTMDRALRELEDSLKQTAAKCHVRCGTHVHMNMIPFTWNNLWSLSVLYTLLEPTIFYRYARSRINSHFCVPSYCNTQMADNMMRDIVSLREGRPYQPPKKKPKNRMIVEDEWVDFEGVVQRAVREIDFLEEEMRVTGRNNTNLRLFQTSKYSAMNFTRLPDLGTVEMRQLETTQDIPRIREWVNFLLRLQRQANTYSDPLRVLDRYASVGLPGLCRDVGLDIQDIPDEDQSEAEDNATFMAGYIPPKWEDLDWTFQPQQQEAMA